MSPPYRGTPESLCVTIADFKPLAGRSLVRARLGAVKAKLAQKYARQAAKSRSKGRIVVLTRKALTFRAAAHNQWLNAFRSLGTANAAKSKQLTITTPYTSRFGVPAVGSRVFVSVNANVNGYEGIPQVFSARVPAAA